MRQATINRKNGIQWTLLEQLDDLDFADDIALLSHNQQQMQDKLTQVEKTAAETDLIISTKKTKVFKANTNNQVNLNVNSTSLEEVDNYTNIGSVVDNTGGSDLDILKTRIGKARTAFRMMGTISLNTRIGW